MTIEARRRLESYASAYLRRLGCREGPFVVSVKCREVEHSFRVLTWEAPPPCEVCPQREADPVDKNNTTPPPPPLPAGLPVSALWLSPLERKILDYLSGRPDWTTGEQIASAIVEPYTHRLKAILTNLVDRQIIESGSGSGYRVIQKDT